MHRAAVTEWQNARNVQALLISLHSLTMQQDWRQWEGVMAQDLSWNRMLYRMSSRDVKFLCQGILQVAPSPAYLKIIGKAEVAVCPLCGQARASFYHLQSLCPVALDQGRLKWRHDEELRVFHYAVGKKVRSMTPNKVRKRPTRGYKAFVQAGGSVKKSNVAKEPSLLELACDWRIIVDLKGMPYAFPAHIAITEERPDLVLWSESLKLVILIELTVPSERNVLGAHAKKSQKYGKPGGLCDRDPCPWLDSRAATTRVYC